MCTADTVKRSQITQITNSHNGLQDVLGRPPALYSYDKKQIVATAVMWSWTSGGLTD